METAVKYLLLYPAEVLALLALLALLVGVQLPRWWALGVGGLASLALVVRTAVWFPECFDLRLFWDAGQVVLQGGDPYRADVRILNPPTVLPFFALCALLSFDALTVFWTILNVALSLALAPLAAWALNAQRALEEPALPMRSVAVVLGVTAFSYATRRGLDAGQVSLFFTMLLLGALVAQGYGRSLLAGGLLAVASVKAATWLPFLLLFARQRDWPAWAAMAVVGLALALLGATPAELVERCRECLDNIRTLSMPGRVNDYLPENTQSVDLLTLNHAVHHLGVTDRTMNALVAFGLLGMLTLLVLWFATRTETPRPAACAAVCIYAMLFLYHRQYDAVLLTLPLLHATGRAAADNSWRRWLHVAAALCIVGVFTIQLPLLEALRLQAVAGNLAPIVGAVVMPYCTWALLMGLLSLIVAEWSAARPPRQPGPVA